MRSAEKLFCCCQISCLDRFADRGAGNVGEFIESIDADAIFFSPCANGRLGPLSTFAKGVVLAKDEMGVRFSLPAL